jgi:hypothetical protein
MSCLPDQTPDNSQRTSVLRHIKSSESKLGSDCRKSFQVRRFLLCHAKIAPARFPGQHLSKHQSMQKGSQESHPNRPFPVQRFNDSQPATTQATRLLARKTSRSSNSTHPKATCSLMKSFKTRDAYSFFSLVEQLFMMKDSKGESCAGEVCFSPNFSGILVSTAVGDGGAEVAMFSIGAEGMRKFWMAHNREYSNGFNECWRNGVVVGLRLDKSSREDMATVALCCSKAKASKISWEG